MQVDSQHSAPYHSTGMYTSVPMTDVLQKYSCYIWAVTREEIETKINTENEQPKTNKTPQIFREHSINYWKNWQQKSIKDT